MNLIEQTKERLFELEKIGKNSEYVKELSNLALLQVQNDEFEESKNNLLICLKHFKKQHDRLGQAAVYGLLGTINFKSNFYEESIKDYERAKDIYVELNQTGEIITCLKGIGNSLIKLNKID